MVEDFSCTYTRAYLHTPLIYNQKVNPSLCIKLACLFATKTGIRFLASYLPIQIPEVILIVRTSIHSSKFMI